MRFTVILVLLALTCRHVAAEEYVNDAYGIKVKTSGDWRILNSASLQVDLGTLTDDQLTELFNAYKDFGVVGLDDRKDATIPRVRVHMKFPRGHFYSAIELAERYVSTSSSRTTAVPAKEMTIGGVKGAYSAVRVGANPSTVFHHFIIRRARSYVVVTAVFSGDEDLEEQLSTMTAALSDWQIDLQADRRD